MKSRGPPSLRPCSGAQVQTLPEYFAAHGYRTLGVGKVFDGRYPHAEAFDVYGPLLDHGPFPDDKLHFPQGNRFWDWGPYLEPPETHDDQVATWAAERLVELASAAEPFFLAVGFYRPHVPSSRRQSGSNDIR